MRAAIHFLFSFGLFVAAAANAGSFNPFSWLNNEDEQPVLEPIYESSEKDERAADAQLKKGIVKFDQGNLGSANRIFKSTIKKYSSTESAAEALYMRGQVYMARERWVKAFGFLQQIIDEHPRYKEFNKVLSAQFECATALMEGARGRIFGVLPAFKQYPEAIGQFEQIILNAPYGEYAPLSLMNIAFVAKEQDESEIAIDALDRLINYYPESTQAPDAYATLADIYASLVGSEEYDQGSTRQAISYYEDFLVLFPDSKNVGEVEANLRGMENLLAGSRLSLGDFYYLYRSNNTAALVFYNEAITIAPDSDAAIKAKERIKDIDSGVRPATGGSLLKKILFVN
ncbi:MAG: tetratricopeptide repeat protein [Coraliomargaritaceae bacterium]